MLSSLYAPFDCSSKASWSPRPSRTPLAQCAFLIALLGCAGAAQAAADDGFSPYASLGYNYDDNLFRLGDGQPGYDNTRGDYSTSLQAGGLFSKTYGRQDIALQAKVSRVSFRHFSQLDYNGKDMLADWHWRLGNHLEGKAGVSYSEVLAPYTDIVTRDRNLRTQRHAYADGGWTFHPSWRVRLAYVQDRYKYDLQSQTYNNRVDEVNEAGLDYLASSGSTIGLQVDQVKRKYDQLRSIGNQLIDAGSTQDDVKLKVVWRATPVTTLQFLGGWADRKHAFYTERDSSGVNARLQATTVLDGKVTLDGAVWRQFEGVESAQTSYALNTGASVNANWNLSAKLLANASARYQKRDYNGLLVAASGLSINDSSRNVSAGLTYVPLRLVQLNLSAYRESRNGLAAAIFGNGSYRANGVSFNINLQY
ncbi:hypothetical protein GTP58_29730 [Duganella sp. CY15W]|uniref:XrtB/PEP-CTERM-associated polysaccharide biosynthesis outer membrane protein EpsL n=1 Tax=Duganella sp. CY15W TaxID=2692172 RepID=UPI00136B042A|nr:XrtB/PEP-CTERM-associated polysaccharide biosynthesis outer membrane protein EpsL [Duganella sp. CY15W]MYM32521.1 hypothetical protein [Duganella sp. CY15W]